MVKDRGKMFAPKSKERFLMVGQFYVVFKICPKGSD